MHELAATGGHLERGGIADRRQVSCVSISIGIRVKVPGHILDELAAAGGQSHRQQHCRQVRPASTERHDRIAVPACQKPWRDDDVVRREAFEQAHGTDTCPCGRVTRVQQSRLVHVDAGRVDTERLQAERDEGDGAQLASRPEQIAHGRIRGRAGGARGVEKSVRFAALGRNHYQQPYAGLVRDSARNESSGVAVPQRTGQHGASDLDDRDRGSWR